MISEANPDDYAIMVKDLRKVYSTGKVGVD